MKEARAGKYGRCLAVIVNYVLDDRDRKYKQEFIEELKKYSFKSRRRGESKNKEDYELNGLENIDLDNPEHLARLIKEGLHLMYQKQTTRKVFDALIVNLELHKS